MSTTVTATSPATQSAVAASAAQMFNTVYAHEASKQQQKRANEFNIEMWNRQNAYNTPAEQMRRFREAGLNPNLIYGQGNSGNAGSAPTFEKIASEGLSPLNVPAMTSVFNTMYDIRMKNAQVEKLQSSAELDRENALARQTETLGLIMKNAELKAKMPYVDSMAKNSAEALALSIQQTKANIQKTNVDTQFTIDENQRQWIDSANTADEKIARIAQIQTGTKNLLQEIEIKKIQEQLARQGIDPKSPWYIQNVANAIKKLIDN